MRKSLADISWQVDEPTYRADNALSYSKLSQFFKHGPKALISNEKIDTPALRSGSLVDCLLTAPEEFDDRFYVADIDKFSDTIRKIVEWTANSTEVQRESLSDFGEMLLVTLDEFEYQTNWKPETRIKKLIELGSDYYTVLKYSTGKIVISPQEFSEAQRCCQTLRTHPFTYKIFDCNEDEEIFYQLKFKSKFFEDSIRCMFDIIKVNHDKKTIEPIDLKTTGHGEEDFEKSFMDFNYWIQSGMYSYILREVTLMDENYINYTILPFKFLVINKNNLSPLIWVVENQTDIELKILDEKKISWKKLLMDANFHLNYGKFDYSRKSYENNGCNPIILKL